MSHDLSEVMTFVLPITPDLVEGMSCQRFRLGMPECRESGGSCLLVQKWLRPHRSGA